MVCFLSMMYAIIIPIKLTFLFALKGSFNQVIHLFVFMLHVLRLNWTHYQLIDMFKAGFVRFYLLLLDQITLLNIDIILMICELSRVTLLMENGNPKNDLVSSNKEKTVVRFNHQV